MANRPPSYAGEVYREWWNDVRPKALDQAKGIRSGVIGLVGGLVVALGTGRVDTAENAAITTAIGIVATLIVGLLAHILWSWATAPRRVFYRQRHDIEESKAKLAEMAGKRLTPVDALERVERLMNESETLPLDEWYAKAVAVLSDCFIPYVANSIQVTYDNQIKNGVRRRRSGRNFSISSKYRSLFSARARAVLWRRSI